jgi:excinuclease UvrABC ATPase subunit
MRNNQKDSIYIHDAHANNLKHITLSIPKGKLVVFTGVSGSGKSSLLFDTIYTEAQRQLIDTFSTFARARLPKLSRPDVEEIENLSTAIVIDQKPMGKNLRSTVGTATEINTYLRILYSRFGSPQIGPSFLFSFNHPDALCPQCHGLGKEVKVDIDTLIDPEKSLREGAFTHPECKVGGWFWREITSIDLFDPDKKIKDYSEEELYRLLYTEPIPITKTHGSGTYAKNYEGFARTLERRLTNKAEDEANEKEKTVYDSYFTYRVCEACDGTRLNERARTVKINEVSIAELCRMELVEAQGFLKNVHIPEAGSLLEKCLPILDQLIQIGVGYLSLERPVSTLSGGEAQRVKMARQLDCNLTDLMYILDEPSIGLHPRDSNRMIQLLRTLRDRGNSVLVVEHDAQIIESAEWIVDMGPRAGMNGGELMYNGPFKGMKECGSITASMLKQKTHTQYTRKEPKDFYVLEHADENNLKDISVHIPRGLFTCVTGVAGSGKSSLIDLCFMDQYPDSIFIDQSPIGRSSRANPATYMGLFDKIRKLFHKTSRQPASLFSFNSKGACENCKGQGYIALELSFLDAVRTTCDSCGGSRFKASVLEHKLEGKNIAEVLDMTFDEAEDFFNEKDILKLIKVLREVGLGYIKLGQSLSSLSGGESQRLKLASQLHKEGNIYVMDEPTTGLHMSDVQNLYRIIQSLCD